MLRDDAVPKAADAGPSSTSVQPDGGVNRCLACRYVAPVRDFHQPPPDPLTVLPRRGNKTVVQRPEPTYARATRVHGRKSQPAGHEPVHMPNPDKHFWWQDE